MRDPGHHFTAYGPDFWFAYLSNTTLMIAVSILFRYADFVTYLGGSELKLGLIAGTGMTGALLMRTIQGVGIDRFGPRQVWLLSSVLLVISLIAHLWITTLGNSAIYVLRIMFASSVAGALGASITYVSLRAPPHRMAEMIGILGTSGFIGISLGPIIGDLLFSAPSLRREHVDRMFLAAAVMSALSLAFAAVATRHESRPRGRRRPPPVTYLLRRYQPGAILIVGMAMGLGIGLPHTFLRTFTADLGIGRMKVFFLVYALVALTVRISTRRLTQRWGVRPVIHVGLGCLAASMISYLLVRSEWTLVIPAAVGGTAHALLFPAVVAGANVSFPPRYRGLATALIMAMFDLGILIGQPTVGAVIDLSKRMGLPPYATMFSSVAAGLLGVSAFYALSGRRRELNTRHGARAVGNLTVRRAACRIRSSDAGPCQNQPEARNPESAGHA